MSSFLYNRCQGGEELLMAISWVHVARLDVAGTSVMSMETGSGGWHLYCPHFLFSPGPNEEAGQA